MMQKFLITLCLVVLSTTISRAQIPNVMQFPFDESRYLQDIPSLSKASNYQTVTNWGETNCGCQLSIGLDTNVIHASSSVVFHWWIKNSSAGNVLLAGGSFSLFLTNDLGKTYPIKDASAPDAPPTSRHDANSGEFIVKKERVRFSRDIEPGDYVIKPFTRDIVTADGKTNTLTSNSLKVQIVK
jgi:hypothetical protein